MKAYIVADGNWTKFATFIHAYEHNIIHDEQIDT